MADSILRGGVWWNQRDDGSWLRWNPTRNAWEPSWGPPPPPDPPGTFQTDKKVQPIGGFARTAEIFLWIAIVLDVIAIVSDLFQLSLVQAVIDGDVTRFAEIEANDARQAAVGGLQLLALSLAGIFFIRWIHRAFHNVHGWGATRLPATPGWAIGYWFIPILSLFRPKQIVDATYKASDPELPTPIGENWSRGTVPAQFHWWWGLWIVSGFLGYGSFNSLQSAETSGQIMFSAWTITISDFVSIIAGVLAIGVVRALTQRQQARGA